MDGLDSNGWVLADRWHADWHDAEVRVWGTSTDDNRVGPDVLTHTIRLKSSSDYTIDGLSQNVDMRVAEDDTGSITLEPQYGGSGPTGFRVWRTLEGSPRWELTYDVRGAGWTSSGSSITSAYQNLTWRPGTDTGTVLERGFTSMDDFAGTVGLAIDCSLGPAEIRLGRVERGGENLSARTPGTAGYVSVDPADEWVNVCPPAAAGTVKATASLTVEKRYQCWGMNFEMGEERLELEWHTAGADANGVEIGVSKDLGLDNGVYRSSATRINLAVGSLTAAEIRDLINSKTVFQNDSRANPIRVTAVGPSTVAAKMVDGSCEYSQTFLGFDVSAARVSFSGGR
ncbi:hypothetical protein [Candidatus Poriferisodalis sp.]|uniref:hypothetical protein n=1 Tax=Candidatus Poriferisodalis sp. TaxID=3101277 RepID=UPI003B5B2029